MNNAYSLESADILDTALEYISIRYIDGHPEPCMSPILAGAIYEASNALRKQSDLENNEPLTKEEMIKYMADGLPCWIETITAAGKPSGWGLAGRNHTIYQDFANVELLYATYGTCWIAYRRPPNDERVD